MRKIAILGGGAAGLCCVCALAQTAGDRTQVTVFEQNDRVGKKLLTTGNGRCNLTNLAAKPDAYPAAVRDFAALALTRFSPESTIAFFERLSLFTYADDAGRVYPLSNQAAGVLDALRLEAARLGVVFSCESPVTALQPSQNGFVVNDRRFDAVVLAFGGKAAVRDYPGEPLLRQLGLPLTKTAPGLCKLQSADPMLRALKGLRARAALTLLIDGEEAATERGELQFADGALSGIALMDLSSVYARAAMKKKVQAAVAVDFVPTLPLDVLRGVLTDIVRRGQREKCEDLLSGLLVKKLGVALLKRADLRPDAPTKTLTNTQIDALCQVCKNCVFTVTGSGSFRDAQVTVGGLAQQGFDPATLESRQYKNLYAIGELLDVDGPCGGFNLQWAFASARLCAAVIAEKLL